MKKTMGLLAIYICAISNSVFADNSVTINNNYAPPSEPSNNQSSQNNSNNSSNCNNPSNSGFDGAPQGTSYQSNPHGGTDTVYSTGNKQPYVVDNNCNNNQPPIIPQVYPNMPGPGPYPDPTPIKGSGR